MTASDSFIGEGLIPSPYQELKKELEAMPRKMTCKWEYDPDLDAWETECDHMFILNDGTPRDNEMSFCPYCGDGLVQVEPKEEEGYEEDEDEENY